MVSNGREVLPRSRECAAPGCQARINRRYLMCRPHWYRLAPELRAEVWDSLREGGPLSEAYIGAVERAVASLA